MSICYLMSPLQHQVGTVLHEFIHSFEMPSAILGHKVSSHNLIELHQQHEHTNLDNTHEHPFIDLVETVLEASNENKDSDKIPLSKIKKHLTSDEMNLPKKFKKEVAFTCIKLKVKLHSGHFNLVEVPPKNTSSEILNKALSQDLT